MSFKWPCNLHSCVSPDWLPNDVVVEFWNSSQDPLRVHCESSLSFSEFTLFASQLAELLCPLSPSLVGILWRPCLYMHVAVHGVLLSACAFLPFSDRNSFPELQRLFRAVISLTSECENEIRDFGFECIQDKPFKVYIRKDSLPKLPSSDLAYCVATSGSTGVPKLALASHSCVSANVIDLCTRLPKLEAHSGIFITSPLTFDACTVQIYLGLASHRRVVLPSQSVLFSMDGKLLAQLITSTGVDTWQCTPSIFGRLPPDGLANVKKLWVFLGGEPCSVERLPMDMDNLKFFFMYGLTEVSAWSSIIEAKAILSEESPVPGATPLGSPMAHSQVVLKDVDQSTGFGQVYISRTLGGYSTVIEPFTNAKLLSAMSLMSQANLLPTGDYAIAKPNSSSPLWFLGRQDRMVKVHGKKCYLEGLENEILRLLTSHLKKACLRVVNCRCEPDPLRAYIQVDGVFTPENCVDMKQWLLQRVTFPISPHNVILSVASLNLNANGKVVGKSVRSTCLSSISPTTKDMELTFQQCGGSSIKAMYLIESLISDWPALKNKKALLLTTLFSRPFGEFIRVVEKESLSTHEEIALDVSQEPEEKRLRLSANFEAKLVWSKVLGKCVDASPIVDPTTSSVFVGSHSGIFKRLQLQNGETIWSRSIGCRIEATACLTEDLVVFGTLGGKLYALTINDGAIAWVFDAGGAIKSAPTRIPNSNRLLIGSHGRCVHAIDGGREVWKASPDHSPIVAPIVVVDTESALVGTLGGYLHRLDVNQGTIEWTTKHLGPIFGSPTIVECSSRVVVATADSTVHCLSLLNGGPVWTVNPAPEAGLFSDPLLLPAPLNLLLLASQSGHLHALSPIDGSIEWTVDFGKSERANNSRTAFLITPCIVNRNPLLIIVTRTDGTLFMCNIGEDAVRNSSVIYQLPKETFSVPCAVHLKKNVLSILLGCRDDTVNYLELNFDDNKN
ncbi:unnamed protein product [Mesocestoides corti]|nr:unnamed protein product [Mesocestoides corti]